MGVSVSTLTEIGEVVSEQLDIIPAQIRVLRHLRKQYAFRCGQCIRTASLPAQPIPKSLASPGLLAHVTVSKYQDTLPLYRQKSILQRARVDVSRVTLANWMVKAGTLVQLLINLLRCSTSHGAWSHGKLIGNRSHMCWS